MERKAISLKRELFTRGPKLEESWRRRRDSKRCIDSTASIARSCAVMLQVSNAKSRVGSADRDAAFVEERVDEKIYGMASATLARRVRTIAPGHSGFGGCAAIEFAAAYASPGSTRAGAAKAGSDGHERLDCWLGRGSPRGRTDPVGFGDRARGRRWGRPACSSGR